MNNNEKSSEHPLWCYNSLGICPADILIYVALPFFSLKYFDMSYTSTILTVFTAGELYSNLVQKQETGLVRIIKSLIDNGDVSYNLKTSRIE